MGKRTNGVVTQEEQVPVHDEKRVRLDDEESKKADLDAEWEEFQALIAKDSSAGQEPAAAEEKLDIEIEAGEDSNEGEEEEEVTNTWDEDEMNVEKRLETQEARKKYLADLRARRDTKQPRQQDEEAKKTGAENDSDASDSDFDSDEPEDGWIR